MADFNASDLQEYIEERVKENMIDTAEDFAAECIKYAIKSRAETVGVYSMTDITMIMEDSEDGSEIIVNYICEEYDIYVEDKSEFKTCSSIVGVALDNELYIFCNEFLQFVSVQLLGYLRTTHSVYSHKFISGSVIRQLTRKTRCGQTVGG